jgi:primosomal protein N' (replication factor Y)
MSQTLILKVALPTPLRRVFDYLPPIDADPKALASIAAGVRIQVPFGSQSLTGILLGTAAQSDLSARQLKYAEKLHDSEPCITAEILALVCWAADYYHHPIGDAIATALPTPLRQGQSMAASCKQVWTLTNEGLGLPKGALARSPKQAQCLSLLLVHQALDDVEAKRLAIKRETLTKLKEKGLVTQIERTPIIRPPQDLLKQNPLSLNSEQEHALNQLRYQEFGSYLLEGATGSGKTEFYLQAIEQVLKAGRRALILVPEIGLTPQLVGRFEDRFAVPIVAVHSGLSDGQRLKAWLAARHQQADIVIGTRSAIFSPLDNLGIIIIDEEHDLSFKQQDGFRYSARDLAVVRAQRLGIPLVLGTATPSLESLYNATHNRYLHLRLTQRAGHAKPPLIELLDLRGRRLQAGLTEELISTIQEQIDHGNQALVFLNRRGFAPALLCHDCAWIANCSRCSARLTVHQQPRHLRCHHCDQQRPIPRACPDCKSANLESLGQGTQRSEEELQQLFPRVDIIRVDRDSTRQKNAFQNIIDQVHSGKPCILVGTQMLAKGHHFPKVTLVAIVDVDSSLFSGDFRGPERMGQLLIQVAGRAGREQQLGKVMVQSHHCEHPNIQSLIREGYHRFARRLLRERQLALLPPYRFMALVRAESKRAENATEFLTTARQLSQQPFPPTKQLSYLGPMPALLERKKDRFCFHLQIASDSRPLLHQVIQHLCTSMENHALARRTRWSVDIDPQDMS